MSVQQYPVRSGRHAAGNERAREESGMAARRARGLTPEQLAAIHAVMALFVEDDLARGVPPWEIEYCPACDDARPLPGFVLYDRASAYAFVCNSCATEYEVARMRGLVQDIHEFLRGKSNGAAGAQPASTARPTAQGRPVDTRGSTDQWDDALADLDAVDLASALSFPASDPPAVFGRA